MNVFDYCDWGDGMMVGSMGQGTTRRARIGHRRTRGYQTTQIQSYLASRKRSLYCRYAQYVDNGLTNMLLQPICYND